MKSAVTRGFRRTIVVAVVGVLTTTSAFVLTADAEDFVAGSAKGTSRIISVGPSAARLSFVSSVGLTLADYLGNRSRSESRTFDFAALQGTMEQTVPNATKSGEEYGEGDDNPLTEWDESKGTGAFQLFPNLRIDSTFPGAAQGRQWKPTAGIQQDVSAIDDPVGRSSHRLEGFEIPGLIDVTGGQARSFAGVYLKDGEPIRAAGGTVDIARVSLLDGLLELRGLRWEVAQITDRNDDADPEAIGGFFIARAKGFGQAQEGINGAEAQALFDGLNQGLSQIGLTIDPPRLTNQSGVVNLTPLQITVASSLAGPLLDPLQQNAIDPAGAEFIKECQAAESGGGGGESVDGLLGRVDTGELILATHGDEHEEFAEFQSDGPGGKPEPTHHADAPPAGDSSDCGVPLLVADLSLAPFTGAGRFEINLGGAFGTTEGTVYDNPFDDGFGDPNGGGNGDGFVNPPTTPPADGTTGPAGTGTGGTTSVGGRTTTIYEDGGGNGGRSGSPIGEPPGGDDEVAVGPPTVNLRTSPASAVWTIGLLGLAAALAMAASDYRRIRARSRTVTPIS